MFESSIGSTEFPNHSRQLSQCLRPSSLMANIYHNFSAEDVNQPIGWEMPFLCIYTEQPDPDKVQVFFPDADIHVMEGSHVVQWEKADAVNEMIRDFALCRPGRRY